MYIYTSESYFQPTKAKEPPGDQWHIQTLS